MFCFCFLIKIGRKCIGLTIDEIKPLIFEDRNEDIDSASDVLYNVDKIFSILSRKNKKELKFLC